MIALVTFMVTGDGEQGHPMNTVTRIVELDENGKPSAEHLKDLVERIGAHTEEWARRRGHVVDRQPPV